MKAETLIKLSMISTCVVFFLAFVFYLVQPSTALKISDYMSFGKERNDLLFYEIEVNFTNPTIFPVSIPSDYDITAESKKGKGKGSDTLSLEFEKIDNKDNKTLSSFENRITSVSFFNITNVTDYRTADNQICSANVQTTPNGTDISNITCVTNSSSKLVGWHYEWIPVELKGKTLTSGQTWQLKMRIEKDRAILGEENIKWGIHFAGQFEDPTWNVSFANKKEINISVNLTSSLSNALFPIFLSTSSSHKPDCSDLRFVNGTEAYAAEIIIDGWCGQGNTSVWGKFNVSSGTFVNRTFGYHYYNYTSAENVTNNPSPLNGSVTEFKMFNGNLTDLANSTLSNNGFFAGAGTNSVVNFTSTTLGQGFATAGIRYIQPPLSQARPTDTDYTMIFVFTRNGTHPAWGGFRDMAAPSAQWEVYWQNTADTISYVECEVTTTSDYSVPNDGQTHVLIVGSGFASGINERKITIDNQTKKSITARGSCGANGTLVRNAIMLGTGGGTAYNNVILDQYIFQTRYTSDTEDQAIVQAVRNTTAFSEGAEQSIAGPPPPPTVIESPLTWFNNSRTIFVNDSYRNLSVNITFLNVSNQGNFTQINTTDLKATRTIEALTFLENAVSLASKYLQLSGGTLTGTLISQLIRPSADLTYDLGTDAFRFRNVWAQFINATGNLTASSIYENGNRFPQTTGCGGTNKIRAFASDGTFDCAEDIGNTVVTKLCDAKNCTVTGMQSGYNVTVWAKGVYDGPANPQQVRLFQNTTLADQNQVDTQTAADADSFALIHYMTTNSSNDITYIVDSTAGTLNNTKIMIQVAR